MKRIKIHHFLLPLLVCGLLLVATSTNAQPPPSSQSLSSQPGFVDLEALGVDLPGKPSLKISVYGAALQIVAEMTEDADEDFSDIVRKIQGIRAVIYNTEEDQVIPFERLVQQGRALSESLRLKGWQPLVELESEDVTSFVQMKRAGSRVLGLMAVFIESGEDGSAAFINIVGDVDPADIGRLGRSLDLEPLERLGREASPEPED